MSAVWLTGMEAGGNFNGRKRPQIHTEMVGHHEVQRGDWQNPANTGGFRKRWRGGVVVSKRCQEGH